MVRIAIVGTGYVGLVTGTCLADIGHNVICADISKEKIEMLKKGIMPIYEEGLEEKVKKNVKLGRLSFTTEVAFAVQNSEVIFSAVGTPPDKNHKADLQYVRAVAKTFAENLSSYKIFVNKSTVPVGTGEMVKEIVKSISQEDFDVVSNPEFLREGSAVYDFLNPDRIVIGCESEKAKQMMEKVYSPLKSQEHPIIFTDIKSAELIKYASNSMLALRISFANEMAKYCDLIGANIKGIMRGMGLDTRIGTKFLDAGIGYGGSCFPKDVDALVESGKERGFDFSIIESAKKVNDKQKTYLVEKLKKITTLKDKKFAIWGLAFKPKTDDVRETPAKPIIETLLHDGAEIYLYDPVAIESFKTIYKDIAKNQKVHFSKDIKSTLKDVDGIILVTDWEDFSILDYDLLKKEMRGRIIADGRNIYDSKEVKENGFTYIGIGKR